MTCLVHFPRVPNEFQFLEFLEHISHPINKVYSLYSTSVGVWEPRTRKMSLDDSLLRFEKALAAQRNQDSMNVNVQKAMDAFNRSNVASILTSPSIPSPIKIPSPGLALYFVKETQPQI